MKCLKVLLCIVLFLFCSVDGGEVKISRFVPEGMSIDDFAKLPQEKRYEIRGEIEKSLYDWIYKEKPSKAEVMTELNLICQWYKDPEAKYSYTKGLRVSAHKLLMAVEKDSLKQREAERFRYSLPPESVLAEEYSKLSAEQKADILCDIAETSYEILQEVPVNGLRQSKESLDKVIAGRKWLEETEDVVARMLALRLQWLVDNAVINELIRKERMTQGIEFLKDELPFKEDSFDNKLIADILEENSLDEAGYIEFALSQDTTVGKFCRENGYNWQDFISGTVFEEAPNDMKYLLYISKTEEGIKKEIGEEFEIKNYIVEAFSVSLIDSQKKMAEILLPETLYIIDEARNTRLLAAVFTKYGNFFGKGTKKQLCETEDVEKKKRHELILERLQMKLTSQTSKRFLERRLRGKDGFLADLSIEIAKKVKSDILRYPYDIRFKLAPFIKYSLDISQGYILEKLYGVWLNLPEE